MSLQSENPILFPFVQQGVNAFPQKGKASTGVLIGFLVLLILIYLIVNGLSKKKISVIPSMKKVCRGCNNDTKNFQDFKTPTSSIQSTPVMSAQTPVVSVGNSSLTTTSSIESFQDKKTKSNMTSTPLPVEFDENNVAHFSQDAIKKCDVSQPCHAFRENGVILELPNLSNYRVPNHLSSEILGTVDVFSN